MRKLILQEWISLDGYAEDKQGKLDFFSNIDSESNKYADEDQLKLMEDIDTILLGRKTYQLFADFWPTASAEKEIIADKLNETDKIVFSNTLTHAPWGRWPEATIVRGDAVEALIKIKEKKGKNLVLWGSISLAQSLMKEKLIDEYHLHLCPTATGGGRALFPGANSYVSLNLIGLKKYDTGLILLKYQPWS